MLALDESNADDELLTSGNYTFCVNKELLQQIKAVTIDFTYMGFSVEPEVALGGGGGCGSSGGGCSGCAH